MLYILDEKELSELIDASVPNYSTNSKEYREIKYDFPVCNHTNCIGKHNIGYTQGILADGTPFEAEISKTDDITVLQVIMPVKYEYYDEELMQKKNDMQEKFNEENDIRLPPLENVDYGILTIGMQSIGYSIDPTLYMYVEYLEENNIVKFTSEVRNGSLHYLVDSAGNDIVGILITLKEDGEILARTELVLKPFIDKSKKRNALLDIKQEVEDE